MRIDLAVERGAVRRWHVTLAQRLAARPDTQVGFQLIDGEGAAPGSVEALFRIETLLFGLERGAGARVDATALAAFAQEGEAYLVIDLASRSAPGAARVWRVECDGVGLEPGLLAAALAGRAPLVRVLGPSGPLACARPGTERGGLVAAAFAEMLERVATLIEAALDGAAAASPPPLSDQPARGFAPAAMTSAPWVKRAAKTVTQRAKRAVYEALCHTPHWRVGWRRGEAGVAGGLGQGWTDLPDDGRRFYADPFPVVSRGRTFLFVEEFEHLKAKGVVSVAEFGADGPLGAPEPVLERPFHLSYPNVFERDGEMWMIPESVGGGSIDLYRAHDFPRGWKREATLVADVAASDATLVEHGGRWWMFATVRDGGGAFSDALWLWSAPDFRGPWTAHKRNPVLIDIASARPAGRMFLQNGALWRPVQDCRAGYGAAMALARIDRLDDGGFAQTVETLLRPGPGWPGRRLHTYNAGGGFEFIDGSGLAPRWPALRRPLALARRREMRLAPA